MGKRVRILERIKIFAPITLLVTGILFTGLWKNFIPVMELPQPPAELMEETKRELFSHDYPVAVKYKQELAQMRRSGKLLLDREISLHKSITQTSFRLDIPQPLLWCLFFQESRLNHLSGYKRNKGAYGLGQFSYFGFYEINHQINRFSKDSLPSMIELLGKDVRPISPSDKLHHPSSYYNIPTAVVSSSLYLNNRYLHLKRLLHNQDLDHDPDLLWLYTAMAYNKGSRSVLAYWNVVRWSRGEDHLNAILNDREVFLESLRKPHLYLRALKRIWPAKKAIRYAKELSTHMKNIVSCSVEDQFTETSG